MKESQFNTIVCKSLDWGYKISDYGNSLGFQRMRLPFDGFGIYKDYSVYFESKYLQEPKSFSFSRLEDHQLASLIACGKARHSLSLFLVGITISPRDKRCYFFRDLDYLRQRKKQEQNIIKKEWLARKNWIPIKKGILDIQSIIDFPQEQENTF